MPGYKQWADGDVLLPSELDEYIVGQTIMRFASAAARSAALASPVAGMRSYLVDTGLEYIYANGVWAPLASFIKKTTTQSVTNSTTPVDDTHFQVTLPVGTYEIRMRLSVDGPSSGDFQSRFAFSGTAGSVGRHMSGPALGTTQATATSAAALGIGIVRHSVPAYNTLTACGTDGSNAGSIQEDMYFEVTATGLLKYQWAQATANASPTNVAPASYMRIERLA